MHVDRRPNQKKRGTQVTCLTHDWTIQIRKRSGHGRLLQADVLDILSSRLWFISFFKSAFHKNKMHLWKNTSFNMFDFFHMVVPKIRHWDEISITMILLRTNILPRIRKTRIRHFDIIGCFVILFGDKFVGIIVCVEFTFLFTWYDYSYLERHDCITLHYHSWFIYFILYSIKP